MNILSRTTWIMPLERQRELQEAHFIYEPLPYDAEGVYDEVDIPIIRQTTDEDIHE